MARFVTEFPALQHCPGKRVWKSGRQSILDLEKCRQGCFTGAHEWLGVKFLRTLQFLLMNWLMNLPIFTGHKLYSTDTLLVPGNKEVNKTDAAPIILELLIGQKIQRVMQESPEKRLSMVCSGHWDRENGWRWHWRGRWDPGQVGPLLCAKGFGPYSEGNCVNQNIFYCKWKKFNLNNLW